tara:strand:+ start:884 stop:1012 length:129 start_codon:yes stop_codon:yes gene_type:complete
MKQSYLLNIKAKKKAKKLIDESKYEEAINVLYRLKTEGVINE